VKIDFEDGGYVEFVKSHNNFNEIYIVVATKEDSLTLNINTATVTLEQFKFLTKEIFS
jgi:hypothetical protein